MSDDLVEWLRLQLDEDERLARGAHQGNWHLEDRKLVGYGLGSEDGDYVVSTLTSGDAEHIANWDPARVLREVEAKRLLIENHPHWDRCTVCPDDADQCPNMRLLATVYSDRPGYREEWRPA